MNLSNLRDGFPASSSLCQHADLVGTANPLSPHLRNRVHQAMELSTFGVAIRQSVHILRLGSVHQVAASCMSYVTTFFFPGAGMCIHDPVSLLRVIPRTYQSPVPICKAIPIALLISVFCVLPYILSRQICPCLRFFSTSVPEKTMQNQISEVEPVLY